MPLSYYWCQEELLMFNTLFVVTLQGAAHVLINKWALSFELNSAAFLGNVYFFILCISILRAC